MRVIFVVLSLMLFVEVNSQVKISANAVSLHPSSITDMETDAKGLLVPRMTTTQRNAITSPAEGLIIYNTSTGTFNWYRNRQWSALENTNVPTPVNRLYGGAGVAVEGEFDEELRHMVMTMDGGSIAVGSTRSASFSGYTASPSGRQVPVAMKLDANGDIKWFRDYGSIAGPTLNAFDFVTSLPGGDVLVTGNLRESVIVARISDGGRTVFTKIIAGVSDGGTSTYEYNGSVLVEGSSSFLVGASAVTTNNDYAGTVAKGMADWVLFRMDQSGNIINRYRFGGSGNDYLGRVIKAADGNFLMLGTTESPVSGDIAWPSQGLKDLLMIKLRANGDTIWTKRYGGSGNENFGLGPSELGAQPGLVSILETVDDGFLFACETNSGSSGDVSEPEKGNGDIWLVKTDKQGAIIWNKLIGGSAMDRFPRVIATKDGNYLLAFSTTSSNSGDISFTSKGNADCCLMKLGPNGNILWKRQYGGSDYDHVRSILEKKDGNILFLGRTNSSASGDVVGVNNGKGDAWVLLLDANGRIIQ